MLCVCVCVMLLGCLSGLCVNYVWECVVCESKVCVVCVCVSYVCVCVEFVVC